MKCYNTIFSHIFIALTLCGCVSHVDLKSASQQLSSVHICCSAISAFTFQNLAPNSTISPNVDASTPAFSFGEDGASHFMAYNIPKSISPMHLAVNAYLFADGYPAKKMIAFVPKILLFDSAMKLITSTNHEQIKFARSDLQDEPSKPAKLEVALEIEPSDTPHYIVIYTPHQYVGSRMQFVAPEPGPMLRMEKSYVSAGPGLEAISVTGAPVAPSGTLSIKLLAH